MRTEAHALHEDALRSLQAALESEGLIVHAGTGDTVWDLVVEGPLTRIYIEVKAASTADPGRVALWINTKRTPGRYVQGERVLVCVADEIPGASRQLLRDSGWGYLDRRGRLWFSVPGILINDTELSPVPRDRTDAPPDRALTGRVGLGVALRLLTRPGKPAGVRELARELRCSTSSAHAAMSRLRAAALVETDGRPLVPELFWATAEVWHPNRRAVAREPSPDEFHVGISSEDSEGWVLSGDIAAAAWGARLVVSSASPPDFYVPAAQEARQAVRRLGEANWLDRAATIAVAPVASVTTQRELQRTSRATPWLSWPLAHPAVVALDLAQDKSRGREILEEWTPPDGYTRVW